VVGLIGGGQEIHVGEEAGLGQWRSAVESAARAGDWTVHAPLAVAETFDGSPVAFELQPELNLDTSLRQHQAADVHRFVASLLEGTPAAVLEALARRLEAEGFHLRLTRSLETAKGYLRERYAENRDARFGLVASSRDRDLEAFDVANSYQATKSVRYGPWYGDPEDDYGRRSCRHLETCVTEFGAQGLELDATLLAWGTDFVMQGGRWSNANARRYKRGSHVKDPFQLRMNAYRVLLTRARDVSMVFVPRLDTLDETFDYLRSAGFRLLDGSGPVR
jgi:hypothetical protein